MKISIIGCGNMGQALAKRLSGHHDIFLFDRNPDKLHALQAEGAGTVCNDLSMALESEIIILAVKPSSLDALVQQISPLGNFSGMIVSILSGTTLEKLQKLFPKNHIVRMMPNLAVQCGKGLLGLVSDIPSDRQSVEIESLCKPLGTMYWLSEDKMDAFTALAGSGPAFVFVMIEAMVDAGIAMGFNSRDSSDLVCQMMDGSLSLLESSGKHPGELKWQVTSPGGTTIAGLKLFEEWNVRAGLINTFMAAYQRAKGSVVDSK